MYRSTVTITLTSSTTADVVQIFDYSGGVHEDSVDEAEVTYSMRKTGGGGDGGSGGDNLVTFEPGGDVPVTSKIIGPAGGTIEAGNSGTPIDGVVVRFPAGALIDDTNVSLGYNTGSLTPNDGIWCGATISLSAENTDEFFEPVEIIMPFNSSDGTPVPYYINEKRQLRPMQLTDIDDAANTFTFISFHASFFTMIAAEGISEQTLRDGFDETGYLPSRDGFRVPNVADEVGVGSCAGMSQFSLWYFVNVMPSGGHFFDRFPPDVQTDIAMRAHKAYSEYKYKFFKNFEKFFDRLVWGSDGYRSFVIVSSIIKNSGPVEVSLALKGDESTKGHSVVAYAVGLDDDLIKINIYDPNFEGRDDRSLDFSRKGAFIEFIPLRYSEKVVLIKPIYVGDGSYGYSGEFQDILVNAVRSADLGVDPNQRTFQVLHNGARVQGATVTVTVAASGILAGEGDTNANGEFTTPLAPGTYMVEARNAAASYGPVQHTISGESRVTLFLTGAGGSGTVAGNEQWYDNDPGASSFTITTADQLAGLASLVNSGVSNFAGKTVYLRGNIDLGGREWVPIGTRQRPFQGTFDGAKSVDDPWEIRNMTITGDVSDAGLFGAVASNGTVRSLRMRDVNIATTGRNAGSVAGYSQGKIQSCWFSGSISAARNAGGIVGEAYNAFVAMCSTIGTSSSVSVSAASAGGIVGSGAATTVTGCRVDSAVLASQYAGGIAGQFTTGLIEGCNPGGYVFAESQGRDGVIAGGVVGIGGNITVTTSRSSANISAYATAGDIAAGGIVGYMSSGEVSGCTKNSGLITGRNSTGTLSSGMVFKGGIMAFNSGGSSSTVSKGNEFSPNDTLVQYGISFDGGAPSNRGCAKKN
jgi:hypothetical protein